LKRTDEDISISLDFLSRKNDMVLGRNKISCRISPMSCGEIKNTEE